MPRVNKPAKRVQNKKRAINKPRKQPRAGRTIVRGLAGLANQFMPGAGSILGAASKFLGFGAYSTEDATKLLASRVPSMHATLDSGVRISHHEYLADVNSATLFTLSKYPINPGVAATFPWLSTVASAFQEYELNGLVFFFKATSANALNSTNTALGQIVGATQYNPYATDPPNKIAMLGLSSAADGKPSESNIYPVECKADMVLLRSKLIRDGDVKDDLAKYDHGNFYLAAVGSQATAVVGELHIVYDLTLKKPRLSSSPGTGWYYHEYSTSNSANGANPFLGTSVVGSNSLGVFRSGEIMSIPATSITGSTRYRLTLTWSGTAAAIVKPTITLTNASALLDYFNAFSSVYAPIDGVSSTVFTLQTAFISTQSGQPLTVRIGTAGTLPTASNWDVVISEVQ